MENQPTTHKANMKLLWFYALSAGFLGGFAASWFYDLLIRGIEPQFRDNFEDAAFSTFQVALTFWLWHFLSNRAAKKKLENIQK